MGNSLTIAESLLYNKLVGLEEVRGLFEIIRESVGMG